MFLLRRLWVPAFFRDWEMSGLMRTSSRSESENHMFGQLMKASSTLVEFFTHFETAMQGQRFEQSKNNHESVYTTPDILTEYAMEKHALRLFTRNVFFEVQEDMLAASKFCMCFEVIRAEGIKTFTIVDTSVRDVRINESIDRETDPCYFDELIPSTSKVEYFTSANEVRCSCKKFERFGLLCRHIYYVLRMSNVVEFPKKYISNRWVIDAVPDKDSQCGIKFDQLGDNSEESGSIIKDIYQYVDTCVNMYMSDCIKLALFRDTQKALVDKAEFDMGDIPAMGSKEFIGAMLGVPQPDEINIHPPKNIRNKGCRTKKRITSSREESMKKAAKNIKKCGFCKSMVDHDRRNCTKRLELIAEQKRKQQEEKMASEIANKEIF